MRVYISYERHLSTLCSRCVRSKWMTNSHTCHCGVTTPPASIFTCHLSHKQAYLTAKT